MDARKQKIVDLTDRLVGDFSFPYPQSGRQVQETKNKIKNLFFRNEWPKQIHPLSWLIERFAPVPGWDEKELAGIKKFDLLPKV